MSDKVEKFEHLLDLEFEVRGARASVAFQGAGTPLYRKQQIHEAMQRAQTALFDALDSLTEEEMRAYGEYRLKEIKGREVTK